MSSASAKFGPGPPVKLLPSTSAGTSVAVIFTDDTKEEGALPNASGSLQGLCGG
jgi:hypothetical protein